MLQTVEGQRLSHALQKCLGLRRQMLQTQKEGSDRKKLKEDFDKYKECLGYVSCPMQWKEYTQCWTQLSRLDPQKVQERGGIDLVCRNEIQSLEQCVGGLVSGAIRHVHDEIIPEEGMVELDLTPENSSI